jgi:methyl-accepting chemotaxis protein
MSEIASASMEQTVGIEQITSAVSQMDEVTQQNAALVEQAAAAAASLQEQAASLAEVVSVFKVVQEADARSAPPAPRQLATARAASRAKAALPAAKPRRAALANGAAEDWEAF